MTSQDMAGEERFRLVVEYSPVAMLLVNGAGSIEMVNLAAESLFGYTRTELVGQPVDLLVPEALLVHHGGHRADFAAAPSPRAADVGRELQPSTRTGSDFP
jgi:PAS domain S-box-containing protein